MNNLRLYHKLLGQICQWFPEERITRKRNLAVGWLPLVTSLRAGHGSRDGSSALPGVMRKPNIPGSGLTPRRRVILPKKTHFRQYNCMSIFSHPTLGNTPQKSTKSTFRLTLKIELRKTPFGPFMPGIKKQPDEPRLFFA